MFTETFFISLTWAIVVLVLFSLVIVFIFLGCIHEDLDYLIRRNLDEAEELVNYLRFKQKKEDEEEMQED